MVEAADGDFLSGSHLVALSEPLSAPEDLLLPASLDLVFEDEEEAEELMDLVCPAGLG